MHGRRFLSLWVLVWASSGLMGSSSGARADVAEADTDACAEFYGFGPMEILKLNWHLGRCIVADLNGDGLNDLVVINNDKARIELLLQKANFKPGAVPLPTGDSEDINDIFGRERTWRFRRVSFPLDVGAADLVVADVNNDHRLDLAYSSRDHLYVALQEASGAVSGEVAGKASGGIAGEASGEVSSKAKQGEDTMGPGEGATTGAPRAPVWHPVQKIEVAGVVTAEHTLGAGDLNGDGRTDLAVLGGDGVFLVLQQGDGTLGQPQKFPTAAENGRGLYVADLNGDGREDLFIVTNKREYPLWVRCQNQSGRLGPEIRFDLPLPTTVVAGRFGSLDRACLISVSAQSGRVLCSALARQRERHAFPVYTYPLPNTEGAEKRDIVGADLDGDGLTDVILSDPGRAEFLVFAARADSFPDEPRRFPGFKDMRKLCAVPLDDSGRAAVAALSVKEKLIGISSFEQGRLTYPAAVDVRDEPVAMDVADLDGDGRADLVYVAKTPKKQQYTLRSVLDVGGAKAHAGPVVDLAALAGKDPPRDLRVADLNEDERADVIIVRSPYEPLLLLLQGPNNQLAAVERDDVQTGLVTHVLPENLSVVALPGSGKTAALLTEKTFVRALAFDNTKGWQVQDQYQADNPQSRLAVATVAALEPGGERRIITYDQARRKVAFFGVQADGTYRIEREIDVPTVTPRKILAGNFGGEVPVSVLLAGGDKLVLIPPTAESYALRQLARYEPDITKTRFGALAVGDLNSDGRGEIALCDRKRHQIQVLAFDRKGELLRATSFKVFEQPGRHDERREADSAEPRAVSIGDVTGDGRADLIVLVHDRIIIYPQD